MRQGPLQRYFGIADVLVQTAGGGVSHGKGGQASTQGAHVGILQGLDDAEAVRDQILAAVKRTRGAGLGDERTHAPAAVVSGPAGAGLSAAHLAMLREIRDGVRKFAPHAFGSGLDSRRVSQEPGSRSK